MAARPLVSVFAEDGTTVESQVPLPGVFSAAIRPDIVQFVHTNMAKNARQPYAVSVNAAHQHSAQSWGTGRAVSRIPRVQGGGTSASGQGAFGNMCRGGHLFAPTKVYRKWHHKINTNQRRYATVSALAASALTPLVMARGHRVDDVPELPLVMGGDAEKITKTSKAVKILTALGAKADLDHAADSKQIRPGKGKMRNRRYTMRRGPLVVYAEKDTISRAVRNLPGVETASVDALNLLQLAPGGHVGRFIVWTKAAFERLEAIYGSPDVPATEKTRGGGIAYELPAAPLANADIARIINSEAVQGAVRPARPTTHKPMRKKNPLKNLGAMVKLNPHALVHRRAEILASGSKQKAKRQKTASKPEFFAAMSADMPASESEGEDE